MTSMITTPADAFDASGNRLVRTGIRGLVDRVGISTLLYCVAFVVWVAMLLFDKTFFYMYVAGNIHRAIRLVVLVILVACELIDWRKRGFSIRSAIGFAITCLIVVVALIAQVRMQIDAALFVFCARNRDFEFLAKVFLFTSLAALIVIIACAFAGVIENTVVQRGRERVYLGFRYALYPAACMMAITLTMLYFADKLRGGRLFVPTALALAIANIVIFLFTDSRLSCGLSLVAIAMVAIAHFWGRRLVLSRPVGVLLMGSFVVAAATSIALTVAYSPDNAALEALNSGLGNRLEYGQRALAEYGVPLLGQDVEFVGNGLSTWGTRAGGGYFYVDNIYVRILVEYGVLVFAVFLVGYTLCVYKAWKSGNAALVLILFILAMHGMVDNLMMYLYYNPFLLLFGALISDNNTPFSLGRAAR